MSRSASSLIGDALEHIRPTRNRIAHGYAHVDLAIIRRTVETDLPAVEQALRQ